MHAPEHDNWFLRDGVGNPVCLSTRITKTQTHLLIRRATACEYYELAHEAWSQPASWIDRFWRGKGKVRMLRGILKHLRHDLAITEPLPLRHPQVSEHLINMNRRLTISRHPVGLVYAGQSQGDFDQMLANNPSLTRPQTLSHCGFTNVCKGDVEPQFWEFLAFLGKPGRDKVGGDDFCIRLEGHPPQSIFYHTKWQQSEFTFHVGPLMPSRPDDPQNVGSGRDGGAS